MATHSSVLAWIIPRMGKPGGPPSVGSHRVRHDWSDLAAASIVYICKSQSPNSSHPCIPFGRNVFVFYVCLYFCFSNKIICTVFLDSTYVNIWYLFFSFWLTFLCMTLVCPRWLIFLPFHGWIIFHCLYLLHLLYPFLCPRAFRFILCPG